MAEKTRTGIIFGGKSAEHEISLRSAKNVAEAIDKTVYDITLIGIDKTGTWRLCPKDLFSSHTGLPDSIDLSTSGDILLFCPGGNNGVRIQTAGNPGKRIDLDVVFPILHGTFGEDGTVQGMLKLLNLPFVGAGVTGSAVGMDKDVAKRLLRDNNIPIARFFCIHKTEVDSLSYEEIANTLGNIHFIKPVNLGSSVGVSKVRNSSEFDKAVNKAFIYDTKIIIEEMIVGREIECSVLGNENPEASLPGEIIPVDDFYSYNAKYIDENGAKLEIPAQLPDDATQRIKELAVRTFKVLSCEGMARVDFFLKENGEITIPGFTKISMYPKLWDVSGIPYSELIHKLIQLAIHRFAEEMRIQTSFIVGLD